MSLSDILKNIDLNTIGAAVKGLNEADEKITANKFKIRAGDLAAKRDSLIKRKNANYEIELKSFYKEKEKADSIASLNAEGIMDTRAYASKWLALTNPVYLKTTDATERTKLENAEIAYLQSDANKIVGADGKTTWKKRNYTATGESAEELEAKYADQEAKISRIITDETIKQSEKSFLINKILGIKDTDTDIDAQIAAALKAEKKVKDLDDKGLTGDGLVSTTTSLSIDKSSKKYQDFAKAFHIDSKDTKKQDFLKKATTSTYVASLEMLNDNKINLEDYTTIDKDGNITGLKGPAKNFFNLQDKQVRQLTNYIDVDYAWKATGGDIGKLAEYTELGFFKDQIRVRTVNYASIYESGQVVGASGNLGNLFSSEEHAVMIPSSNVIGFDNQLVGTDIFFTNRDEKQLGGDLYGNWVLQKAKERAAISNRSVTNEINILQDEINTIKPDKKESALANEAIEFIKQGFIERNILTEEEVTGKIAGPTAVDSKVPAFATVNKVKSLWIPAESTGTKKGIFIDLNDKETVNQFKTADYEGKEAVVKLIEQHETEVVEKTGKNVETIKSVEISLEDKAKHFGIPLFVRAEGDTSKTAFSNWKKENPTGMMKHTFENLLNQILEPIYVGGEGRGKGSKKTRQPTNEEIQIRISELLKV